MATGTITPDGVALVEITVGGKTLLAVLDTGFEGGVQLPFAWRAVLNPPLYREIVYELPTGERTTVYTHKVPVEFCGRSEVAEVFFSQSEGVLVGLDLLRAYRVTLDFPAGTVTLERP